MFGQKQFPPSMVQLGLFDINESGFVPNKTAISANIVT